jgi:TonB family protein
MSLLIDVTLKVSCIVLIALVSVAALRRRSAAVRHWVLSVALVCAAVVPALGLIAPAWRFRVDLPSSTSDADRPRPIVDTSTTFEALPVGRRSAVADSSGTWTTARYAPTWPGMLRSIWIAGVGLNLLILGVGLTRLTRIARRAGRIESGRWVALAHEISRSLRLRRAVPLLQSDDPALLVTWGLLRPNVLLPGAAFDWSDERARIVLRHELAHVARGDWAIQIAAEVLRAFYWFNPLVWIACRRLREESEHACDDAVINGGVDGPDYATHLVDLARALTAERRAWLPAPEMARPSSLEGRISAMLNASLNRSPLTRTARAAIVVTMLTAAVCVAGAQTSFFTFSGLIVDQTNRAVAHATVVLTNTGSQSKYEVRSQDAGQFEFVGLPNGDYALEVTQAGFMPVKDTIRISSRNITRNVELQVGSIQETITITAVDDGRPANPVRSPQTVQDMLQRAQERRQAAIDKCSASVAAGIGGNIVPPMKLVNVPPTYPDSLKSSKIGGVVTMEALIGTDGTVRDVRVMNSPHPDLEAAAIDAVRQWQFSSTLLDCAPIEVRMKVTTNFIVQPQ